MKPSALALLLPLSLAWALAACGAGEPEIRALRAWSRPTAPGAASEAPVYPAPEPGAEGEYGPGVAYVAIANEGGAADRLLSVRSSICSSPELHRTVADGDRMRMMPVENGVEIPPGETVEFGPGGLHIMLNGLHHELLAGERFELVLIFERSGEIAVESEVRRP